MITLGEFAICVMAFLLLVFVFASIDDKRQREAEDRWEASRHRGWKTGVDMSSSSIIDDGSSVSDAGLPKGEVDPYGQVRTGKLISEWGDAHAAKCAAEREQARRDLMRQAYQAYRTQRDELESDTLNERLKTGRVIDD
jgi:hypothetical protein